MIRLRMVNDIIYFAGGTISEAGVSYLVDRAGYCRRLKWLALPENSRALCGLFE